MTISHTFHLLLISLSLNLCVILFIYQCVDIFKQTVTWGNKSNRKSPQKQVELFLFLLDLLFWQKKAALITNSTFHRGTLKEEVKEQHSVVVVGESIKEKFPVVGLCLSLCLCERVLKYDEESYTIKIYKMNFNRDRPISFESD